MKVEKGSHRSENEVSLRKLKKVRKRMLSWSFQKRTQPR